MSLKGCGVNTLSHVSSSQHLNSHFEHVSTLMLAFSLTHHQSSIQLAVAAAEIRENARLRFPKGRRRSSSLVTETSVFNNTSLRRLIVLENIEHTSLGIFFNISRMQLMLGQQ